MKRPDAATFALNLFRHTVPRGRELVLHRRRIYALPTRHGFLFAVMLAVMLLGSINYSSSLGFMLTFLLASLGLVSILYTYRNIAYLQIRSGKVAPVFAGGEARFTLHLGSTDHTPRRALRIKARGVTVVNDIGAEGGSIDLVIPVHKRGRLTLGRITLSTTFPLGLIRAWAYAEPDMQCIVYPQPGPYRTLPATPYQQQGEQSGTAAGSDDFHGFRAYHPGDSLRHVHWKAVARALPMLTKQFTTSLAPDLWLDWAALPMLDNESRLRILCRQVVEAQRHDQTYGLRIPGVEIAPGRGALHQHRCLEALALYGEPRP